MLKAPYNARASLLDTQKDKRVNTVPTSKIFADYSISIELVDSNKVVLTPREKTLADTVDDVLGTYLQPVESRPQAGFLISRTGNEITITGSVLHALKICMEGKFISGNLYNDCRQHLTPAPAPISAPQPKPPVQTTTSTTANKENERPAPTARAL